MPTGNKSRIHSYAARMGWKKDEKRNLNSVSVYACKYLRALVYAFMYFCVRLCVSISLTLYFFLYLVCQIMCMCVCMCAGLYARLLGHFDLVLRIV